MHQCLSPQTLRIWIPLRRGILDTTLCDQVCQWLVAGPWFSLGTPVSFTNKTDCNDITEILLKVALNTITITPRFIGWCIYYSVQEWSDPFDAELSSLQIDGNNAMVTGTFQHGMTRLWDIRLKDPVQVKTNTFLSYKRGMVGLIYGV